MSDPLSNDLASLRIDRDAPPRSSAAGKAAVWLLAVAALAGGAYFIYPTVAGGLFKTEIATTEISMVSPAQASVAVTSTGYVVAQVTSKVGAKISGRVLRVLVKEGDVVRAGDLLAQLETVDQRSSLAVASSRMLASKARVETAQANLAETQRQVERNRPLVEKGAIGKAQLEDLESRATTLEQQVKASLAEMRASESELGPVKVTLHDSSIFAPISGTVVTKPVQLGELVGPGSGPVLELADFASLLVETDVPEARLSLVKVGTPCEIVLDAYPSKRYRGEALELGKKVNRAKATVVVKVKFLDAGQDVLPDMAARTSFLTKELTAEAAKEAPKKVVPSSAVVDRGGRKVVFVVDGGAVKMSDIRVGAPVGGGFELLDGPPPGTRVVASPPTDLGDGQKIKEKGNG